MKASSIILLVLLLSSCAIFKSDNANDILDLKNIMIGSYDSAAQAAADSTYYDISLHMYPITSISAPGEWLYVEQSVSSMQDKPYRQRVYHLEDKGSYLLSHIYTIDNEKELIGAWKEDKTVNGISLERIKLKEGCEVKLFKSTNGYEGNTGRGTCKSNLRGASYATSVVKIYVDQLTSWDQGFDDKGEQVWGAVKGPYMFDKK